MKHDYMFQKHYASSLPKHNMVTLLLLGFTH